MIEVSWNTALMIYLGMTLIALLGIWAMQHYTHRKQKLSILPSRLYVCEYCHFCYLDDQVKTVTRCPQCRSFNRQNSSEKNYPT